MLTMTFISVALLAVILLMLKQQMVKTSLKPIPIRADEKLNNKRGRR